MVKNVDGTAPAMETMVDSTEMDYSSANETECLGKADASQSAETTAEVFEKYIETSWWKANLEAYTNTEISTSATTAAVASTSPATSKATTKGTSAATKPSATATTSLVPTTAAVAAVTSNVSATTSSNTTPVVTTSPAADEKFSYVVGGTKYRGNAYDVVCQIVSAEMSSDFNQEAIKAQAIATYSYLKYSNQKGVSPSVSVKTSVPTKIAGTVKSVFGLTAYYNGSAAQTVYCASTGGYTLAARNVWNSDIPYLQSVVSEYDSFDRYYGINKTFTEAEVRSIVEKATGFTLSNDPANWFTPLSAEEGGVLDGGYVGKMLIDGNSSYVKNGSTVQITGRVIRENIFGFRLNSAKFTVTYNNGTFTFKTYGYGHGVGMSQLGSNLYATKGGYDYMQILQHYYPGITVS